MNIDYFSIAHENTHAPKKSVLHSKCIDNIYPTKILSNKMGLSSDKKKKQKKKKKQCLWCTEIDYIEHAFYQCTKLENFWRKVKQYILISYDWRFKINERVAIFGRNTSMANVKTLH